MERDEMVQGWVIGTVTLGQSGSCVVRSRGIGVVYRAMLQRVGVVKQMMLHG